MRTLSYALAALLAAPLVAQDTIVLVDGDRIDGVRVTDDGLQEVVYEEGRGRRAREDSVDAADVVRIELGDTTEGYRDALGRRDEGDLAVAATWLEDEADAEGNDDVLRAKARVEAGELWRMIGAWGQATAAYDELLRDFPRSRHVPRARLGKARVLMGRGDASAEAAFEAFVEAAESGGWGRRWVDRGRLFAAAAKVVSAASATEGAAADAIERASAELETLRDETASESVRAGCELWLGRIDLTRNPHDALPHFETVLETRFEIDREFTAGAFNGRGRCSFAFAQAASDPEDKEAFFIEALMDFLRVVVRYRDIGSEQAHALFWSGQSFLNTTSLTNAAARGRGLLKECAERFPGSLWGQRAAAGG